jgi:nucleotide-binding universal stress UspA family protein/GNAT superfamily N-acetyltransferase
MKEIVLVHVIHRSPVQQSSGNSPAFPEVAHQSLEEKRVILEQMAGVPVTALLVEGIDGDTAGAIIGTAKKENIPLIVMGGRGQGMLRKLILGSVSDAVVHRSRTDILIMHFRGMDGPQGAPVEKYCQFVFSHILCPVDFSRPSENTLAYIRQIGAVRQVTLLHVIDPTTTSDLPARISEAEKRLFGMESEFTTQGIQARSIVRSGKPVQEIGRVADELDVSLIFIARYGQSDYVKNIPLGRVTEGVLSYVGRPLFILNPHVSLSVSARELGPGEFYLAEQVWTGYHQQKGDPGIDRIFGVFVEGTLAAVARCRTHPDGLEVDGVFVPVDYRGRGYARSAVQALIDACGKETLFMHATLELVGFYGSFGFVPIDESTLPATIRERFSFAAGEMAGADVQPMQRPASRDTHKNRDE